MSLQRETARLDEYDADEWFEICKRMAAAGGRPVYTREQFDASWRRFQAFKARRRLN